MGEFKISVLLQEDHKYGDNKFIEGKIMGYAECICKKFNEERRHFSIRPLPGIGRLITTYATIDEYAELKTRIEDHYPGLCKFGIVMVVEDK